MKQADKLLLASYFIAAFLLLLYSYTQVDLNLTLTQVSLWQKLQQAFQYIGYYQRPLSTWLYSGLLALLFSLYALSLILIKKGHLNESMFWKLVGVTTLILIFSYPAFSYDFFNYIFTAKTILVYHKNPYLVIPLQFWGVEPLVNVMRWIHLPSAYTPLWIVLTLPAYLVGFNFLLTIIWSIKTLVAAFHLLTIWGIGKILARIEPQYKLLGMAIFALNPLIIIENLVSSHNDVVMMFLALWAISLFLEKQKLASWFVLALSVAAKLMTAALIPVWFFIGRKGVNWRNWMLILMVAGLLAVTSTREVLPWYWVWIVPFVALLPSVGELTILSTGVSLGLLLRYAPYLYLGHWDHPVPIFKLWLTSLPILLAGVVVGIQKLRQKAS